MIFLAIYEKDISVGDSLLIALISMLLVFIVLTIIYGIVSLMKYIKIKDNSGEVVSTQPVFERSKNVEIKDDDMMAAVLVATIDYVNETKKDVRLVSVEEIK